MKKLMSGILVVLFVLGFALVPGVHTAAAASEIHPMCWAGYCPDMTKWNPADKPADPADPPSEPAAPSPMGNVGY